MASAQPPHGFLYLSHYGQGGNGTRAYYQGDSVESSENQVKKDNKTQSQEQAMEIGYEDNPLLQTFEGLEKKFLNEIMKLVKEHTDAEDAENVRHREKIIDINAKYLEKLSALRAQHATRREEFLRKESQARLHQYQESESSSYPSTALQDVRGYGGTMAAAAGGEPNRSYVSGQFESYRERPQYMGSGRTQGADRRVPYPEGRVYNTGARYY